jgi:hypothetical protein
MRSLRTTAFALSFVAAIAATRAASADPAVASTTPSEIQSRIGDPADPPQAPAAPAHDEVIVEEARPMPAARAVQAGAFLPFTVGASSDTTYAKVLSGYDGGRREFVYEGAADASVYGGLSVRAGYSSTDLSGHASALLGARFQFLSQKRHGIDLGTGLFYLPQGIDGEGLVRASVFVGRDIGKVALFGNVSYGQDPEGDDHHAELSVASLFRAAPQLMLGADARMRALVLDSDEKHNGMTEPVLDLAFGPVAHYVLGPVVLTGQAGLSALALKGPHGSIRPTIEMQYGTLGLFSAGFAL